MILILNKEKKFEMIFTHVMAFVCAVIIAGIFDYALHKIQIEDAQIVGLLGTMGGLYALYKKIKKYIGNKLLAYLCKKKKVLQIQILKILKLFINNFLGNY